MQVQFTPDFLERVNEYATIIARRRGAELRTIQKTSAERSLAECFADEVEELRLATEPWDELPDVGYYAACMVFRVQSRQDAEICSAALQEMALLMQTHKITLLELQASVDAKYSRRAAGEKKDIMAERIDILNAVQNESQIAKGVNL